MENFDIKLWLSDLDDHHLPKWEEFPDFELYMEQLVSLGNRYLACFSETPLTSSMINSYVKKGLMSRPEKKRYRAEHIAELIVISLLKTTYPLETIRNCIERVICDEESVQIAYDNFSDRFNQTLHALIQETIRFRSKRRQLSLNVFQFQKNWLSEPLFTGWSVKKSCHQKPNSSVLEAQSYFFAQILWLEKFLIRQFSDLF